MANVSKGYGVGDSVFVFYADDLTFTPQARTVTQVDVLSGTNEATVKFSDGKDVTDGATQRVFTTQALCAKGIIDDIITKTAATVALDTTTSIVSTAGQASSALGRIG